MIKVANIQIKVPLGQVNLPGKAMKTFPSFSAAVQIE